MAGSRKKGRIEPDQPTGSRDGETDDLDGRSMAELRRMARELDVTNYDALDRDGLVEAIQHGRGEERSHKGGVADPEYGTGYTEGRDTSREP